MTGYRCNCGEEFPGTLHGAWTAKLHVEDHGHHLRGGGEVALA